MRHCKPTDRLFFDAVADFRITEASVSTAPTPVAFDAAQHRLGRARTRLISQRSHSLQGVLWRLLRLHQDMAETETDPLELASLDAAIRDLRALIPK